MGRHLRSLLLVSVCALVTLTAGLPCWGRTLWVDGGSKAADEDGSTDAAFRTIGAAMRAVRPGDAVIVRAGVYREQFAIPSGEPGKPITLRAADGGRVVVTGCVPLEGWKKTADGLWVTMLDWKPERLMVGSKIQTIAREPNQGWWRSAKANGGLLIDPENLRGIKAAVPSAGHVACPAEWAGGQLRVWLQRGNIFETFALESLDARTGQVTLKGIKEDARLTDGDKYYLQNRAEFIDRPGEWAVEPAGPRFRIFFKPHNEADLRRVETPLRDRALVHVRDQSHVRIEGLEVTGSRQFGIQVYGSSDVVIRRCIVHHNDYMGISLREAKDCVVAQNIVRRNGYGISVGFSSGVTVEENDVGYNDVDGVLVTWRSDDVTVRRNFVHHHLLWGHPDNLQVYRGVTNARFQENLLLAGGQSVMMEETRDGEFSGNMVVGCGAYMLIMGHGNAGHYKILGNTLALSGYGCMNLTWEDYDVRENVMMTGHGSVLFGLRGVKGYRGDRNVFWNSARSKNPRIIATNDGWHRDFEAVRNSTGQDKQSLYADPKFRNAPLAFRVLDQRRLHQCTRENWYLRGGTEGFNAGDYVEVNFDGTKHRITHLDEATITVKPGLKEKPIKGWLIANWGDKQDFRLDLRLADQSPGAGRSSSGGPVGSQIDIQAYLRGDFDGDGHRDLPELPPELQED